MKRSVLFWILAVVITIASAVYQRLTGPTYPLAGAAKLASGQEVSEVVQKARTIDPRQIVSLVKEQ